MKTKLLLQMMVLSLICVFSAQSAYALRELGRNPFYNTPLGSEDEMKSMLLDNRSDVEEGLRKAGHPELFEPMMTQLERAEVTTNQYQPGQQFPWMFYRRNGQGEVRIDKDVVWEGDEPFDSYDFAVDYEGQRYTFTVPPVCGNLTLVGVGPVPAPPVAPPVAVTEEPAPTPVPVEEPQVQGRRFPFVADAGYLRLLDPANLLLLRVGMEFPLSDNFSIIPMVGGAIKLSGSDGDDAFIIDVFANYQFSRFFVGFGLGGWFSGGDSDLDSEDDDLDIILNAGTLLFGDPDGFNTSLFLEARSGIDELDDFDYYGRIGAGLRFRF